MSIVDQIIDLNTVAMMGGTELERFYVTPMELDRIFNSNFPRPSLGEIEKMGGYRPGLKGCVDGVAIIVREVKHGS